MKHNTLKPTCRWWQFLVVVAFVIPVSWLPFAMTAHAAAPALANVKSLDVMKYTKDVMTSQPSDAEITSLVQNARSVGASYVAISTPMDPTADYPVGSKPAPRTAEQFTQVWADAIHSAGLHVIWRGTWNGLEGLYGFAKLVGSARVDQSVWLGKIRDYITSHPTYFADGDMWAPLPERTEGIFSDSTSFLPSTGAGLQANYANFFAGMKAVSGAAFAAIGRNVATGMTANNASEILSGWIPKSLFDTAGYTVVDYYGSNHTPAEMDHDIRAMYEATGKPVFMQEWGDYWDDRTDASSRSGYLASIYAEMRKLESDGILAGVSYWGGWDNAGEGILDRTPAGFTLNSRGSILRNFFSGVVPTAVASSPAHPIDMSAACSWQYPGKNASARQDASGNNYLWTCYGTGQASVEKLGGVDLGSYCQSVGRSGSALSNGLWSCDGQSIDMHAACSWQYPGRSAADKQDDPNNPYSWSCYGSAPTANVKLGGIDLGSYCASQNEGGATADDKGWACKL